MSSKYTRLPSPPGFRWSLVGVLLGLVLGGKIDSALASKCPNLVNLLSHHVG